MSGQIPKSKYLEGLEIIEKNADLHLDRAVTSFKSGDFRAAYFFGFTAWEEYGKALLLSEKIEQTSISKREWMNRKSFRGHEAKIKKAEKEDRKVSLKRIKKQAKEYLGESAEIEISETDVSEYPIIRNDVLHVDYDFVSETWKSPSQITEIKKKAILTIIRARGAKTALNEKVLST